MQNIDKTLGQGKVLAAELVNIQHHQRCLAAAVQTNTNTVEHVKRPFRHMKTPVEHVKRSFQPEKTS